MNRPALSASIALLVLSSAGVAPLRAHDGGDALSFPEIAQTPRFRLSPAGRAGEVLWESGPSQPATAFFEAVLIQGVLKGLRESDVAFEASRRNGAGWTDWVAGGIVECYPNGRFWAKVRLSGAAGDVVRVRAVSRGPAAGGA